VTDLFTNAPIPILGSDAQLSSRAGGEAEIRTLIHMDEPDHAKYRKLTSDGTAVACVFRYPSQTRIRMPYLACPF